MKLDFKYFSRGRRNQDTGRVGRSGSLPIYVWVNCRLASNQASKTESSIWLRRTSNSAQWRGAKNFQGGSRLGIFNIHYAVACTLLTHRTVHRRRWCVVCRALRLVGRDVRKKCMHTKKISTHLCRDTLLPPALFVTWGFFSRSP